MIDTMYKKIVSLEVVIDTLSDLLEENSPVIRQDLITTHKTLVLVRDMLPDLPTYTEELKEAFSVK